MFEKSPTDQFSVGEFVYVISANDFDVFEGVIEKISNGRYWIHYPEWPNDDEDFIGTEKLLKETNVNKKIYQKQNHIREKFEIRYRDDSSDYDNDSLDDEFFFDSESNGESDNEDTSDGDFVCEETPVSSEFSTDDSSFRDYSEYEEKRRTPIRSRNRATAEAEVKTNNEAKEVIYNEISSDEDDEIDEKRQIVDYFIRDNETNSSMNEHHENDENERLMNFFIENPQNAYFSGDNESSKDDFSITETILRSDKYP